VPVAIHIGPGPQGAPYIGFPKYRMGLSNPLLLEEVLVRHPKLRIYVMHAGWPMADAMIALMYAHPQVYVDLGVINWTRPAADFLNYLKRMVQSGFGKRIMFGSDQMVWPEAISIAIENILSADFLSRDQRSDIFYKNAERFLKLK
jgi:predicted TIM-barrel fold metal-dependent hydrolase